MIFDIVIYVTLINLKKNGMYSSTNSTNEVSISLFTCFRIFNFGQIKFYFVEIETSNNCFIANVNVYRYSNLIKMIIILETAVLL